MARGGSSSTTPTAERRPRPTDPGPPATVYGLTVSDAAPADADARTGDGSGVSRGKSMAHVTSDWCFLLLEPAGPDHTFAWYGADLRLL
jgi:hypothetical protein